MQINLDVQLARKTVRTVVGGLSRHSARSGAKACNHGQNFYNTLSRRMSYALRHNPEGCGLHLDSKGRTAVESLLEFLNFAGGGEKITKADIAETIARIKKKRFEFKDGMIRAYYGHSFAQRVEKEQAVPPRVLFHGTSHEAARHIEKEGLTHQQRQYVHMSTDKDTAIQVGRRKDKNPVMIFVDTKVAEAKGVRFYRGNQNVWLSDDVPAACLYIDGVNK